MQKLPPAFFFAAALFRTANELANEERIIRQRFRFHTDLLFPDDLPSRFIRSGESFGGETNPGLYTRASPPYVQLGRAEK